MPMKTVADPTITAIVLILCGVIGLDFLSGCTIGGAILLHNGSGNSVVITAFDGRQLPYDKYELAVDETKELGIDPFHFPSRFSIKTPTDLLCYEMPIVSSHWARAGFPAGTVLASLNSSGDIYLFPPDADKRSFFKQTPPLQPKHFPLAPMGC